MKKILLMGAIVVASTCITKSACSQTLGKPQLLKTATTPPLDTLKLSNGTTGSFASTTFFNKPSAASVQVDVTKNTGTYSSGSYIYLMKSNNGKTFVKTDSVAIPTTHTGTVTYFINKKGEDINSPYWKVVVKQVGTVTSSVMAWVFGG